MVGMKVCPHCGSTMFAAKIIAPGAVQSLEDGTFKIVSEKKDGRVTEIVMCARCRHEITEDDLVTGVACKECNRVVNPVDVDSTGVCDVCRAKKERADLANASQEDLIKMIINMERAAKGIVMPASDMAKGLPDEDKSDKDSVSESISVEEDTRDTEKKSPRGRRRVAKREPSEEAPQTDAPTDEGSKDDSNNGGEAENVAEATPDDVNNIANQQEAPFPSVIAEDITGVNMNSQPEPPVSVATHDVSGVNNFAMYESDEAF